MQIRMQVRYPDTGLVLTDRWEEGHSWVHNAYVYHQANMLELQGTGMAANQSSLFADGHLGMITSEGTVASQSGRVCDRAGFYWNERGLSNSLTSNQDRWGILVSTTDEDWEILKWRLNGLVEHGNGAGELFHQVQAQPVQSHDSVTKKWTQTIERVFNNNGGETVTVKSLGLAALIYGLGSNGYYLLSYDKLDTPVSVPDGAQLTVTYELETAAMDHLDGIAICRAEEECAGGWLSFYYNNVLDQGFVVAPETGGETTGAFRDPAVDEGEYDAWDGRAATEQLIACGDSDIGDFCAAARAANLGGYDDWYIPGSGELVVIRNRIVAGATPPAGYPFSSADYWSSTWDGLNARKVHMGSGAEAWVSQTTSLKVRLIRRCTLTGSSAP